MSAILIFLLAETTTVQSLPIDPVRVDAELAADADVLRSLEENGDVSSIPRPVDVRFVGGKDEIAKLQQAVDSMGWRVMQRVPTEAGEEALDVQRVQTTDRAAIRQLTETALRFEVQFRVRYDGWGTIATSR